jgi:hypothetical protein
VRRSSVHHECAFDRASISNGLRLDQQTLVAGTDFATHFPQRPPERPGLRQFRAQHLQGPRVIAQRTGVVLEDRGGAPPFRQPLDAQPQCCAARPQFQGVTAVTRPGLCKAGEIAEILVEQALADSGRFEDRVDSHTLGAMPPQQALERIEQQSFGSGAARHATRRLGRA